MLYICTNKEQQQTKKNKIMNNKETIEKINLDIQYLKANLYNGWYIGLNQSKNDILSHLKYKQDKIKRLINEINK